MTMYRIAVIPGDGIGPEVVAQGVRVLKRIAELDSRVRFAFDTFPWGCDYYQQYGHMMPADGLDQLRLYDAIYLGAIGHPSVPDNISLRDLLLRIRQGFDQYVNLRPVKLLPGIRGPLSGKTPADIDMLFVRENVEGEYAGLGGRLGSGADEVAIQTGLFTRKRLNRLFHYAFRLAQSQGKTLTSITKSNALNYSMVLWDEEFRAVSASYPEVRTTSLLVDAAALFMIRNPERFQVVVGSNLFADILTDLGAGLQGGLGLAAAANLNPDRTAPSMFEPVHGSAPDIAGKGIANPIAAMWTAQMMLDHLGLHEWADRLLASIKRVVERRDVLTPDLGGSATTEAMGTAVMNELSLSAQVAG